MEQRLDHDGARAPGSSQPLRRGWTTGACAAAAARAAYEGWLTGSFPDPVTIRLPGGAQPSFALALAERNDDEARAGIVKDAGDDPDVTDGTLVISAVRSGRPGSGLTFRAGTGVGTVTRPGLALAVGEPAINPAPRRMIAAAIAEFGGAAPPPDLMVTVSIPGGEALAAISTSIPRAADSISVGSPIVSARPAHRQRASRPPVKLAAAASCWQSRRAPGLTMRNGSRVSSPSRHARSRSPPSPAPLRLTVRSSTAMGALSVMPGHSALST